MSKPQLELVLPTQGSELKLPLFGGRISAGFASPVEDFMEGKLDLNEYLVTHPSATFYVRVAGDSMVGAGIHPSDILIVDRAVTPASSKVIIAQLNGEFLVKRLVIKGARTYLAAENPNYPEVDVTGATDFNIWGVVTNCIHRL